MTGLMKTAVRVAVIGGVVGTACLLIAGPDRTMAAMSQIRDRINAGIDDKIKDPVALRAQLRDLESQYPRKIEEVRSDLSEIHGQMDQLRREQEIADRVVELADQDLNELDSLLERAEKERLDRRADGVLRNVRFEVDGRQLDIGQAYSMANEVSKMRSSYATRIEEIERDLGYLGQQEERLASLLTQLESERAEFQRQLWQLDRQVDAIARNDRMIDMMKRREQRIEEHSRYQVASLDQLNARLADIRGRQESELASLSSAQRTRGYEHRARIEIDRERRLTGSDDRGATAAEGERSREADRDRPMVRRDR